QGANLAGCECRVAGSHEKERGRLRVTAWDFGMGLGPGNRVWLPPRVYPAFGFDDERTFNHICQPHLRVLAGARLQPSACPRTTRKPCSATSQPGWMTPKPRTCRSSTSGANPPSATTW